MTGFFIKEYNDIVRKKGKRSNIYYYKQLSNLIDNNIHLKIDILKGKYICPLCGKEFNATYKIQSLYRRTLSILRRGISKANAYRHLIACYNKDKNK